MSNFPERDSDDATKLDRLRGYAVSVEGFSLDVLREAERRILAGRATDIDPRFMPTPPQLARLCGTIRAERIAHEPKPLQLERFDAPPDPKLLAKLEHFQSTLAAQAHIIKHESRDEWLERMGDRILRRPLERTG